MTRSALANCGSENYNNSNPSGLCYTDAAGTAAVTKETPLNGLQIERIIDTSLPPVYPKGTILML